MVAYGKLPPGASLTLGNDTLPTTPVPGGLQVTVPEWTVAGMQTVSVDAGGPPLSGVLQVVPRLDSAVLKGNTLTVTGAGWPTKSDADTDAKVTTRLELSGLSLTPTLASGSLSAELPANLPYGPLTLRVTVADTSSDPLTLSREAGAVSGKVLFPGSAAAGLEAQAQARLQTHTLEVEWDAPVHTDGSAAVGFVPLDAGARAAATPTSATQTYAPQIFLPQANIPTPGSGQWFLPLIGIEGTRGEGVVVAVVDTGVDLSHPDLQANLLPGYDFVDNDPEPQDTAGHGTHVAGLVAANGEVTGTAPGANILPVRVLAGTSGGSSFTVAQGILWAAGLLPDPPNPHPAQVVNLSLGSAGYTEAVATAVAIGPRRAVALLDFSRP